MRLYKGLLKPNERILLGIGWVLLALIFFLDRLRINLDFRVLDWLVLSGMFIMGTVLIIEGIRTKKMF